MDIAIASVVAFALGLFGGSRYYKGRMKAKIVDVDVKPKAATIVERGNPLDIDLGDNN